MDGFSRDLLKNEFMSGNRFSNENVKLEEEEDGEIELSLGLSMNGRFGVDPARKKLRRASSISNLVFSVGVPDNGRRHKGRGAALEAHAQLARTCSLPTQAEEWRHRKVSESTRSMEARKKRMEKLKNVRMVKDADISAENGNNGYESNDVVTVKDNVRIIDNGNLNLVENVKQTSQGSIGSQRSDSSGISDYQSQPTEGTKQPSEVKSSSGSKSVLERIEQKVTIEAAVREGKGPNMLHQNAMQDIPFVSTKAYGPNGTKVDGFLYRYKKGEDVRIVCVCHGMFLSPADFVKHGGGRDVEHPLKHIVVNPSPPFKVNRVQQKTQENHLVFLSTKAYGPNGTKVDEFLYGYKKEEDVRIVCVCHGMFLSPAEFVKHGDDGRDVEHPLKHIVVNPSPPL